MPPNVLKRARTDDASVAVPSPAPLTVVALPAFPAANWRAGIKLENVQAVWDTFSGTLSNYTPESLMDIMAPAAANAQPRTFAMSYSEPCDLASWVASFSMPTDWTDRAEDALVFIPADTPEDTATDTPSDDTAIWFGVCKVCNPEISDKVCSAWFAAHTKKQIGKGIRKLFDCTLLHNFDIKLHEAGTTHKSACESAVLERAKSERTVETSANVAPVTVELVVGLMQSLTASVRELVDRERNRDEAVAKILDGLEALQGSVNASVGAAAVGAKK